MRARLKHKIGTFVLIAGFAANGLTVVANDTAVPVAVPLTLESSEAAFGLDAASGRILWIKNRKTDTTVKVAKENCLLELSSGNIDLASVAFAMAEKKENSCSLVGRAGDLEIVRTLAVQPGRAYLDRGLSVRYVGTDPHVVLKTVADVACTFEKPFRSNLFHEDVLEQSDPGTQTLSESEQPSLYRSAINVFMRNEDGGLFLGLKYPYFKASVTKDAVALAYETNFRLIPGEAVELPAAFVGVFTRTGFSCRKALHWTPRILSAKQEELDWGEVRAMQALMADYLPECPTGFDGYFMWLNSWWANRTLQGKMTRKEVDGFKQLLVSVKQSKCLDLLGIAPVWCGWAGFTSPCPEIDMIGADAKFPANPFITEYMTAAREMGVPTSGFCEPASLARHYRKDRPDWAVQPTDDPAKRINAKCQANDEYSDWFYRLQCNTIDTFQLKSWSWDHCWVRRPMICHATNHGHEPGNCEFQQYRNVTGLIQKLRTRYPTRFLEIYWGLKEAGPWSLRGLNSLENAYENASPPPPGMGAADDMRFQHWYNHNYRFIPTHLNIAHINITKEKNGHLYSLLSCLSASKHAQLSDWVPFETDVQATEVFAQMRRWKTWASGHLDYLRTRVDLFGQPCRKDGIDGTAHVLGDRGYFFVFNPWEQCHWGSITLDETIGLQKSGNYAFSEISGERPRRLGVCRKKGAFLFSIPARSAMLIEMVPTDEKAEAVQVPAGSIVQEGFTR